MNKIKKYINYLDMMGILLQEEKQLSLIIQKDEKVKKRYLSIELFEALKEIILQNNETNFIDLEIKRKIFNYLYMIRKINLEEKPDNYKEILNNINECICMCNLIDSKTDSKIFYANELYLRMGQSLKLDICYQTMSFSNYINSVKNSIISDFDIFNHFFFEELYKDPAPILFVDEKTLWSINKIIYDLPIVLENKNFVLNCKLLNLCMKKNKILYFKQFGLDTARRVCKENKSLQKKLR